MELNQSEIFYKVHITINNSAKKFQMIIIILISKIPLLKTI